MKIVSVLVFALALIGSWMLAQGKRPVGELEHLGIQNDLKSIIAEAIQKHVPNSQNLRFQKFWTEVLKTDRVKASFVYTFEDISAAAPVLVEIGGSAILNKLSETEDTSTWSLDELKILDNKVDFQEPIQVTAGSGELEGQEPAPKTEEADKEKDKAHH